MKTVTISAPGKLMLLGEHAVVYGYPSIVTAVNQRLRVHMEELASGPDIIETPQVKDRTFLSETLSYFRAKYKSSKPLRIQTVSEFSHRMGFGSSSAVTAAILKGLSIMHNIPLIEKKLFSDGYDIVLKVQGTGSGFDIAAAVYGGTLSYVKGGELLDPIPISSLPLIVGYSGVKADTTTLIHHVQNLYLTHTSSTQSIFETIEKLVLRGKQYLNNWMLEEFGALMTQNHRLLQELTVSTDKLDHMVDAALSAGAWGAKLSGAGGGDCMIALAPIEAHDSVKDAIRSAGGEIVDIAAHAPGLTVEYT